MCHGAAPRRWVALGTDRRRLGARRSNTEAAPSIGRAVDTPELTGADGQTGPEADRAPRQIRWRKAGPSLRSGFGLRWWTVLLKRRFGSLSRGNSCTSRRPNPKRSDGPASQCRRSRIDRLRSDADQSPRPRHWRKSGLSLVWRSDPSLLDGEVRCRYSARRLPAALGARILHTSSLDHRVRIVVPFQMWLEVPQ